MMGRGVRHDRVALNRKMPTNTSRRLYLPEAGVTGAEDCFGAVGEMELAEDV